MHLARYGASEHRVPVEDDEEPGVQRVSSNCSEGSWSSVTSCVNTRAAASTQPADSSQQFGPSRFYGEYHGHKITDLEYLLPILRGESARSVVWLVGDSTLDNKYWLPALRGSQHKPCCGYEKVLSRVVPDVAFWVNKAICDRGNEGGTCCINTAIEESTLADRAGDALMEQDVFVRDHMQPQDTLVVSVGGNDVALRPSVSTIVNMLLLTRSPTALIRSGLAPGTAHFIRMFREATVAFVRKLIGKSKPKRVVVCTLYFLDVTPGGSWADATLARLGYDRNPSKLQEAIRMIHALAHSTIRDIEGVEVVPIAFFKQMDGTDPADYAQRVEPSIQGGEKMGKQIAEAVFEQRPEHGWPGERGGVSFGEEGKFTCSIS